MIAACGEKQWLGREPEKVYQALLTEIRSGHLQPGSRMSTEKELCARFGVCRNTVRRAQGRLVAEKWLIHRPGAGCMVAPAQTQAMKIRVLPRSNTVSFMYHGSRETIIWLQNLLLKRGYLLSLFSQWEEGWNPGLEAVFLRRVLEERHVALLASCSPLEPPNTRLLAELAASGVRVIHVEPYSCAALPAESFLMPDYRRAGYAAAATLLLRGYGPVFYVGDPKSPSPFHLLQERGFLEAQRDLLGLGGKRCLFDGKKIKQATQTNFIGRQWLSKPLGHKLLRTLGKQHPGFLCATQEVAKSLTNLLHHEKITVPGEAGIIGPELIGDQLTTKTMALVQFPRRELLERAAEYAVADEFSGIRELVPPFRIAGNTLSALDSGKIILPPASLEALSARR